MTNQEFLNKYGYQRFDPFQEDKVFSYMTNTTRKERMEQRKKEKADD